MSDSSFTYYSRQQAKRLGGSRASFCSFGGKEFTTPTRLGEGRYGQVSEFTHQQDGSKIVVKRFDLRKNNIDEIKHEAEINRIVHGTGSVDIHDNAAYLHMKKLPRDLEHLYMRHANKVYSGKDFLELCLNILEAAKKLHEQYKILHGDIKLENVCRSEDGTIEFCDFGFAHKLSDENSEPEKITRQTNSPHRPPELNNLKVPIPANTNQDVFSLGFLFNELAFSESSIFNLPGYLKTEIHYLALDMQEPVPNKRPSIDAVISRVKKLQMLKPRYAQLGEWIKNNKTKAVLTTLGIATLITATVFAWPAIAAGASAAAIFGAIGAGFSAGTLSAMSTTALGIGSVLAGSILTLTKKVDEGLNYINRKIQGANYHEEPWHTSLWGWIKNNKTKTFLTVLGVGTLVAAAVFAWPALIAGSSAAVIFGAIGTGFSASTLSGAAAMNLGIITVTVGALSTLLGQGVSYIKHKFNKPSPTQLEQSEKTLAESKYKPTGKSPHALLPNQSIVHTPAGEEIKKDPRPEPPKPEQEDKVKPIDPSNPPQPKKQF